MHRPFLGLLSAVVCFAATPRFGELPLQFEPNVGQANSAIRYFARTPESAVWVDDTGVHVVATGQSTAVRLQWTGSAGVTEWKTGDRLTGVSHYYSGTKSVTNVPHFRDIRGIALYPGIDLRLHGNARRFEYDFEVAPGADPRQIGWTLPLPPVRDGDDLTVFGMRLKKPEAWQFVDGRRVDVAVRYRVRRNDVSFEIGQYDRKLPLTIDPIVSGIPGARTFVGGIGNDSIEDLAVNSAGEVFVAGSSTTPDTISSTNTGGAAYVSKLSANGSAILYTTYINGNGVDSATAVAVDAAGNVAVAGHTASTNLALTTPFQTANGGGARDAFVAKLSPSGTLLWSSYLGGNGDDTAYGIGFGSVGQIYVSGETDAHKVDVTRFPTTPGVFQTEPPVPTNLAISKAAFIARISSAGAKEGATYVGPLARAQSNLVVDASDNVLIATCADLHESLRVDFPPAVDVGWGVLGVAKLSGDLKTLITHLPLFVDGTPFATFRAIALDGAGTVYGAARVFGGTRLIVMSRRLDGTGHQTAMNESSEQYTGETEFFEPRRVVLSADGQFLWAAGGSYLTSPSKTTSVGYFRNYATADLSKSWETTVAVGSSTSFNGLARNGGNFIVGGTTVGPYPAGGNGATAGAARTTPEGNEGFVTFWQQSKVCNLPTTITGPATLPAEGGTVTITANVDAGCAWNLDVGGVLDAVLEGGIQTGNRVVVAGPTVKLKLAPNGRKEPIYLSFMVAGSAVPPVQTIQAGGNCVLAVSAPPTLTAGAGSGTVAVTANPGYCEWSVRYTSQLEGNLPTFYTEKPAPAWLTVSGSGSGSVPLQLSWTANPTGLSRSATIQVYGRLRRYESTAGVTVTQPGATCSVTLNKTSQAIAASGGIEVVDLTPSLTGCTLTAVSSADWVVPIVSGSVVVYRVTTNQTGVPRTATLTVLGKVLTITQAAAPACTFTVAPGSISPTAVGGPTSLTLTASSPDCGWYTVPRSRWVNVSPESGKGSATLKVVVAPNYSTSARNGSVDIAGVTVSMPQAANTESLTARYFRMLYVTLFGRHPSPAEIVNWQAEYAKLQSSPATVDNYVDVTARTSLYLRFTQVAEFNETARFVAGLYIGLLDRDPEVEGWRFQIDAMRAGATTAPELVAAFLNSAEYKAKWGTPSDAEFIRMLYRYVLLREPDQFEVNGHVNTIPSLGRTVVATNFLHTLEYYQRIGPRLEAFLLGAVFRQRDNTPEEKQFILDNILLIHSFLLGSEEAKAVIR